MNKILTKIRFGIEIEAEFPTKEDSWKLINRNKMIQGWELDHDGSLTNGAEYRPKDKNKLYFNKESLTQLKEVIALIKVHKGHVRPTCGLHIHVDMKNFNDNEIEKIVKSFIRKQSQIIKKFKVCKSRLEDTAQRIPKDALKYVTAKEIWKIRKHQSTSQNDYLKERYYLLNVQSLNKHGTLEFRLFNGTVVPEKIKRYIKWTLKFCIENSQKKVKKYE